MSPWVNPVLLLNDKQCQALTFPGCCIFRAKDVLLSGFETVGGDATTSHGILVWWISHSTVNVRAAFP